MSSIPKIIQLCSGCDTRGYIHCDLSSIYIIIMITIIVISIITISHYSFTILLSFILYYIILYYIILYYIILYCQSSAKSLEFYYTAHIVIVMEVFWKLVQGELSS